MMPIIFSLKSGAANLPDLNGMDEPMMYLYADGSAELQTQIKSVNDQIDAMNREKTETEARISYLQGYIPPLQADFDKRSPNWSGCTYQGDAAKASKKWKCSDGYHNNGWRTSERESLDTLGNILVGLNQELQDKQARAAQLPGQITAATRTLQALTDNYNRAKEAEYMINLSPQQRAELEAARKAADAAAAAARTKAAGEAVATQTTAQAQARSLEAQTAAKIKRNQIMLFTGIGIVITGVITFVVIKVRKPKAVKA